MNKKIKTAAGFAAAMLLACQSVTFSQKTPDNTNDPNRTPPVSPQGVPTGRDGANPNNSNNSGNARDTGNSRNSDTSTGAASTLSSRGNTNARDWDGHFAWHAAEDNMTEIQLAKAAEQKADDPQIKQFAAKLVKEHEQVGDQLKELAKQKGMRLPMQLDEVGVSKVAALEKTSGPDFDRHFVYGMVGDHHNDVLWYRAGTELITDPDLKQFAEQTLQHIRHHMHEAERLANAGEPMTAGEHIHGDRSEAHERRDAGQSDGRNNGNSPSNNPSGTNGTNSSGTSGINK